MVPAVNVPNVPGVPSNLLFSAAAAIQPVLMLADAISYFGNGPQWGLFQGGAAVIAADSVLDFSYQQNWAICDYPLEKGAFLSYNKVQIPYDVRIRFVQGGSEAQRSALLASVAAIAGDLNLYDAVTPEGVYVNLNVKHYDYRRTAENGIGLVIVDLWCEEIRVLDMAGIFTATAASSGMAMLNGGTVQSLASGLATALAPGFM